MVGRVELALGAKDEFRGRPALEALPALVGDDRLDDMESLATVHAADEAHPIRLDPEHRLERGARALGVVLGMGVVGRRVAHHPAKAVLVVRGLLGDMPASFVGQVLDNVSETATTRRVIDRADLVAEPESDGRPTMILEQDDIEAIVELVVTNRLRRCRERSQQDAAQGQAHRSPLTLDSWPRVVCIRLSSDRTLGPSARCGAGALPQRTIGGCPSQ